MSSIPNQEYQDNLTNDNVTTRRDANLRRSKMARVSGADSETSSLIIEHILSRDEAKDVVVMLSMADELEGLSRLPSFFSNPLRSSRRPKAVVDC